MIFVLKVSIKTSLFFWHSVVSWLRFLVLYMVTLLWKFFLKNWEKSVNSQDLFICPSFSMVLKFFPLLVLSFCQRSNLVAEIVTFTHIFLIRINYRFDGKSQFLEIKWLDKIQILKSNFGQNTSQTMSKFTL